MGPILKKKRTPQFPLTHFIAIVIITISVFLVVGFARRTANTYKTKSEAFRLEEEVAVARARQESLQARLRYAQSDDYVEEIARSQFKWAQPGDTVVVVMATPRAVPDSAPDAQPAGTDAAPPRSTWKVWWLVFFDTPPPN